MSEFRDENGNINEMALVEVLSMIIHEDYAKYNKLIESIEKKPIDELELYIRPALFFSTFGYEGIDYEMDVNNPFFKFPEDQKMEVSQSLTEMHKITDYASLIESVSKKTINKFLGIAFAYVNGDEDVRKMIDPDKMDEASSQKFKLIFHFVDLIKDIMPKTGAYAYDINTAVGLARAAFGVDMLSPTELSRTYLFWVDQAKVQFTSWAEYALSLEIGAAFYCLNCFPEDRVTYAITFAKETFARVADDYAEREWLSVVE